MVSTTVHLLRHGEVHNPEGILYGRLPGYRLSDRGQEMAARVAKHLTSGDREIAAVIASPLQRAQETATPIASAFGVELGTDDRLIEAGNHFEGKRFGVGDGALRQPAHWRHLWNPFRPSWGEAYADQVKRMRAAVASARRVAAGSEVVLVSHQLPVWLTRCSYEGRRLWHDPRNRQCNLASLTSITFEDGRFTGLHYSEPVADLYAGAKQLPGA